MNFTFLFDRHADHITPDEVELPDDWKEFEKVLGDRKKEYISMKHEVAALYAELSLKTRQLETLQKLQEKLDGSDDLKAKMTDMIYSFETEQNIPAIKQNIAALSGKVQAVEKVLFNTNAIEYAKFQCFVCMERYVDVFLDPCGHMICGACWLNTNSKSCPGCRTVVKSPKKIYTLN